MYHDDSLADLPDGLLVRRVAPFWRILAILAMLGMAGFFLVAVTLSIFLLYLADQKQSTTLRGPAQFPARNWAGAPVLDNADEEADAQNLPYPMQPDLAKVDPFDEPPPPGKPHLSPRERFLAKSVEIWRDQRLFVDDVTVSPNGALVAYIANGQLMAGSLRQPRPITGITGNARAGPAAGAGRFGGAGGRGTVPDDLGLVGVPAWIGSSPSVYCATAGGEIRRYDFQAGPAAGRQFEGSVGVVFQGDWPAALPTNVGRLVFVCSRPVAKVEVPGQLAAIDPTEVVLGDIASNKVQVLVPASTSSWRHLAVSPDGKRLALVADRGYEEKQPPQFRVFVMDLEGGEPRPLTPPAIRVGQVAWTADSKALVYARSQQPRPADHWEEEYFNANAASDLFQWDLTTNRETRLSRGGGFSSPSLTRDNLLYYLTYASGETGPSLLLQQMTLTAARELAALEAERMPGDAALWSAVLDQVFKEANVPAGAAGSQLTPAVLAKLADSFQGAYRDRFKLEPPTTLKGFQRLLRQLQALELPGPTQARLTLVLGAVAGEHLVRQYGAHWHLTKGLPAKSTKVAAQPSSESPFGEVANPFATVRAWLRTSPPGEDEEDEDTGSWQGLSYLLHKAEGRPLVLANDPAAGRAAVAAMADPDLKRGTELFKQNQSEKAERVLLDMLKRKQHEKNFYLALQVGKLLYDHQRFPAVRRLMEQQCELKPPDPRKYNLLGLALLSDEPRKAIEAFKNALRCNLYFGPGYLNLAQAYQQVSDRESARQCLHRYLELMPYNGHAADARGRLAALQDQVGHDQ